MSTITIDLAEPTRDTIRAGARDIITDQASSLSRNSFTHPWTEEAAIRHSLALIGDAREVLDAIGWTDDDDRGEAITIQRRALLSAVDSAIETVKCDGEGTGWQTPAQMREHVELWTTLLELRASIDNGSAVAA